MKEDSNKSELSDGAGASGGGETTQVQIASAGKNAAAKHVTAEEDKIPLHEKGLYGLGQKALSTNNGLIDSQIQQVMVFTMGMSPAMGSTIIMIFRLWDTFSDPFMGWISDNTRTPWGRRRPFLILGTILMALGLPWVWQFNEEWSMWSIAIWLTIAGMIMSTFTTMYNIPWQTWKLEMTPDYNERTSFNMWLTWVGLPFTIGLYWIWKLTQLPFFTGQEAGVEDPDTLTGVRNLTIFAAFLILIMGLIPPLVAKERYYKKASKQKKIPFFKTVKETFHSKPFIMMLGIVFVGNLDGLVLGMGAYITTFYVFNGDLVFAATFTGITGTIMTVMAFVTVPFVGWLARRVGKHRALSIQVAASSLMILSIIFLYSPEYPWLAAVPVILNGLINGTFWVIAPAMKADIVDEDELRTGLRREGSFESIFSWFLRTTGTILAGVSGFMVLFAGFDINLEQDQDDGVFFRMKLLMAVVPFIFGAIQLYLLLKWPLTEERMAEIRTKLEERRGKIN